MPLDVMARAQEAAETCDLLIAVGSSLVVEPAAFDPPSGESGGARLVIVNREPTPLDGIADAVVRGRSGRYCPCWSGRPADGLLAGPPRGRE